MKTHNPALRKPPEIDLEFTVIEEELAEEREYREDLRRLGEELSYGFCVMLVRFRIGEYELFAKKGRTEPHSRIPILNVAYDAFHRLMEAYESGAPVAYDIADSDRALIFTRSGDDMEVYATHLDRTFRVPFHDLHSAFLNYANSVREFLLREFPELLDNPVWEKWVRGEEG